MLRPEQVDAVHSAIPDSELYQPVDFCMPVGPIFNFVCGKILASKT